MGEPEKTEGKEAKKTGSGASWPFSKGSTLAALIACGNLAWVYSHQGGEGALFRMMALVLPLAFIWLAEGLGSYTGVADFGYANRTTPGCGFRLLGWICLAMVIFDVRGCLIQQIEHGPKRRSSIQSSQNHHPSQQVRLGRVGEVALHAHTAQPN